jgi:hypothetical protein
MHDLLPDLVLESLDEMWVVVSPHVVDGAYINQPVAAFRFRSDAVWWQANGPSSKDYVVVSLKHWRQNYDPTKVD